MKTGIKLTQLILIFLIVKGWSEFFSLVLETIFESIKDKLKNK